MMKIKMNKLVISFLGCVAFPLMSMAQTSSKVAEALSKEEIAKLQDDGGNELEYLEFQAHHCYAVQDLSGIKDISSLSDVSDLNNILNRDSNKRVTANNFTTDGFNPLLYDFGTDSRMAYYRIGDSGKVLKIYSEERCRTLFTETK